MGLQAQEALRASQRPNQPAPVHMQWLPYIDAHVERDNMRLVTPSTAADGSILLIMNAFW